MCAWLSRTALMSLGRNGKDWLRWKLSARRPWKSPQSSRRLCPQASTRCIEPVTLRVAPQKVTVGGEAGDLRWLAMPSLYRTAHLSDFSGTKRWMRYVPAFSFSHFLAASGTFRRSSGGFQPSFSVRPSELNRYVGVIRLAGWLRLVQSASAR